MKNGPVFGLTVLRYADGRTEVSRGIAENQGDSADNPDLYVEMPSSWELKHAMLIDAAEQVKREAGVDDE